MDHPPDSHFNRWGNDIATTLLARETFSLSEKRPREEPVAAECPPTKHPRCVLAEHKGQQGFDVYRPYLSNRLDGNTIGFAHPTNANVWSSHLIDLIEHSPEPIENMKW